LEIIISVFFFVFAFFCMIFALYEERDTNSVDEDEETKSDNLIIILLGAGVVLFFISAACFLTASGSYYSSVSDTMITYHIKEYEPVAYLPIGFAIFNLLLAMTKGLSLLTKYYQDGT
jgi:protein-S-isoprenylcysteine O-methyltransferase Ste14